MLRTVRRQALAIANMKTGDQACLLHQHYLEVFRMQQAEQSGRGRPRCFPEQDIRFAFEEGGLIFAVSRPDMERSGIPAWTGGTTSLASDCMNFATAYGARFLYASACEASLSSGDCDVWNLEGHVCCKVLDKGLNVQMQLQACLSKYF